MACRRCFTRGTAGSSTSRSIRISRRTALIYLSYLQGEETASIVKVMRARFDADHEALTEQQVIFEGSPGTRPELLGGRIALTGDGYLFLSLGDRWDAAKAQDLSGTAGTIVRIRSDGSIPEDNPFRNVEGARPEIWSYGHRNPQGLVYRRGRRASSGPTSMGRRAATSSTSSSAAGTTAGRSQRSGSTIPGVPIAMNSEDPGTMLPVRYWVPISIAPSSLSVETLRRERKSGSEHLAARWWCS